MIKNIVFDLGNVLISYEPQKFISKYVKKENQEKFFDIVFGSEEWQKLDRGILEYKEAIEIFSKKLPEEKEAIEKLFSNNIQEVLFPIEKNLKLLPVLKENKYNLYILSNFHRDSFLEIEKKCNFQKFFTGKIVSYSVKLLKPEKDIYLKLLNTYNLIPEETLFIDDTLGNIIAANELNIKTIHLKEKENLDKELINLGIKI